MKAHTDLHFRYCKSRTFLSLFCLFALFHTLPTFALSPQNLALIVNANSPASLEIANHYLDLRQIPSRNIVYLDLPPEALNPASEISAHEFTDLIWKPVTRTLKERGVSSDILGWIYSAGFPTRIQRDPPISILGATFTRNRLPQGEAVKNGSYASPLFAGPVKPEGEERPPFSLEIISGHLKANMPLPSMMLGYAGAEGNSTTEIIEALRRGKEADGSRPRGIIRLIKRDDVRSKCRDWQYDAVRKELSGLGVPCAVIQDEDKPVGVLGGYMNGRIGIDLSEVSSFSGGAMAEHLTSFGAAFDSPGQMFISKWVRAGATLTSGTVTEPMAIWTKFTHARFFAHYARGCSAMESYFQAILCPLQILILGDPLCSPWARSPILIVDVSKSPSEASRLSVTVGAQSTGTGPVAIQYYLDGDELSSRRNKRTFEISTSALEDGYHELRVHAYEGGQVLRQAVSRHPIMVNNRGRSVTLTGTGGNSPRPVNEALFVTVSATGKPDTLAVLHQGRTLSSVEGQTEYEFKLDPETIGAGPARLQASAIYSDGSTSFSEPVKIVLQNSDTETVMKGK